ncbi:MAG: hypothetical protein ACI8PT_001328 [Gammaproteobacteria bacterium]
MTRLNETLSTLKACPAWALLLCVALAFAPGANLHIHELDHPFEDANTPGFATGGITDHADATGAHSSTNTSHADHHNGSVTELETSPKAVTKVSVTVVVMALLLAIIFTELSATGGLLFSRPPDSTRALPARYHLVQPARAPPF